MADRGEQPAAAVVLAGELGVGDRAHPERVDVVDRVVAGVVVGVGRVGRPGDGRQWVGREERAGGRVVGALAQPHQPVRDELAAVAEANARFRAVSAPRVVAGPDGALPVEIQQVVLNGGRQALPLGVGPGMHPSRRA